MPGPTQGLGQQNGDAHVGGNQVLEISGWGFEPSQKLGRVSLTPPAALRARLWWRPAARGGLRS